MQTTKKRSKHYEKIQKGSKCGATNLWAIICMQINFAQVLCHAAQCARHFLSVRQRVHATEMKE